MKSLILCGGKGTRLRGYFENTPKPLVKLQDRPLLDYIIRLYVSNGINNIILLVGDDEDQYKRFAESLCGEVLNIKVLQTGTDTQTGGRVKQAESLIGDDQQFMVTYGDGIANVNMDSLVRFHLQSNKIATLTAVRPVLPYGLLELRNDGSVDRFTEKPQLEHYVNGGFFVFDKQIFNFLDHQSSLEKDLLPLLAKRKLLGAYAHDGFWQSMDTHKDYLAMSKNIVSFAKT